MRLLAEPIAIPGRLHAARWQSAGAWAVWALMTVAGLWLAWVRTIPIPYADEWGWLPQAAGKAPVTLAWLWAQHNEHRMFLPRLLYLGLGWATHFDFRAATLCSALLLAGLSAALMITARSIRGRTTLTDAVFPLLLQHWGQASNLVWGFQLVFVLPIVLASGCLIPIARCRGRLWPGHAAVMTLMLLAAGLCGAYCLPHAVMLAGWFVAAAAWTWRSAVPHARRDALGLVGMACVLIAYTSFYFVDFTRPAHHAPPPGMLAALRTTLEFLACGLGVGAKQIWPVSGVFVLAICGHAAWQLGDVLWRQPGARLQAIGIGAFLGAQLGLALAIGWSRAFLGAEVGFQDRYATLASPLLLAVYLQWVLYAPRQASVSWQRVLFVMALVLTVVNDRKGWMSATELAGDFRPLVADLRAGLPPQALAARYGDRFAYAPLEAFAQRLQTLREARFHACPAVPAGTPMRLVVARLTALSQPDALPRKAQMAPGQHLVQPLSLPGAGLLTRIDFRLGRPPEQPLWGTLIWEVRQNGPEPAAVRAAGSVDLPQASANEWVRIDLPDVACPAGQRYELVVSLTGVENPRLRPEIWLFDGAQPARWEPEEKPAKGSLSGFVFVAP